MEPERNEVNSNEVLEEMEYRSYLILSTAERERTFTVEKTLTIDEFEKRLGFKVNEDKYAFDAAKIDTVGFVFDREAANARWGVSY